MTRHRQDALLVNDSETSVLRTGIHRSALTRVIDTVGLFAVLVCLVPEPAHPATEPPQSMKFDWVREGPANACGSNCREWVSAIGTVTEKTPQEFVDFARGRDLQGATVVLESRGGHVLAGIWLGREFRRRGVATTVGKTQVLTGGSSDEKRATLSPHGQCQSICPFILLGGAVRHVPADARISVHQIWPTARLEDAMAATYSGLGWAAEQRQLGQLARYTIEMGGDIALFETAMRIPPWEELRPLTAEEVRRVGLNNIADAFDKSAIKSAASKARPPVSPFLGVPAADNLKASSWEIVDTRGGLRF